jgi:hypothetical protein
MCSADRQSIVVALGLAGVLDLAACSSLNDPTTVSNGVEH